MYVNKNGTVRDLLEKAEKEVNEKATLLITCGNAVLSSLSLSTASELHWKTKVRQKLFAICRCMF